MADDRDPRDDAPTPVTPDGPTDGTARTPVTPDGPTDGTARTPVTPDGPTAAEGVATVPANERGAVDPARRALATWLWRIPVLAAAGGAGYGAMQAYRIHFAKDVPDPDPEFTAVPDAPVAPLTAFARVWDGVDFVVAGVPCVAVRLPQPVPGGLDVAPPTGTPIEAGATTAAPLHLAAFSRICTHLSCIVEWNRDLEAVAFAFNHRSDRPSLTCACHYSVFDALHAGRAVSGPAVRPLPRARLRLVGEVGDPEARLVADGVERGG